MAKKEINMEPVTQAPLDPLVKADKQYKDALTKRQELYHYYMNEEKVPVYLSPQYRDELGSNVYICVNGIAMYIPADGVTRMVPKTFADELNRRRLCIDEKLLRKEKMANVQNNFETTAGEIKLF